MKRVLAIGEARRRLPELVQRIARGSPPILIGARGRPQAVLAGIGASAVERRPLTGLVQIVGEWDAEEIERERAEMVREIGASIERTARLIEAAPPRMRGPKRTRR